MILKLLIYLIFPESEKLLRNYQIRMFTFELIF